MSLKGVPKNRLIIDCDNPDLPIKRDSKRCDFLMVFRRNGGCAWIVALELKKGTVKASKVTGQLEGGAELAEKLVPERKAKGLVFQPVVASGNIAKHRRNKLKRNNLKAKKIRFHDQWRAIHRMRCGGCLLAELRQLG